MDELSLRGSDSNRLIDRLQCECCFCRKTDAPCPLSLLARGAHTAGDNRACGDAQEQRVSEGLGDVRRPARESYPSGADGGFLYYNSSTWRC